MRDITSTVFGQRTESNVIDDSTIKITLKLESLGGQPAHFSATFKQYEGGKLVSFGAGVERYAEHFPALAPYFRWHLCSVIEPLHYLANTAYWIKYARLGGMRDSFAHHSREVCATFAENTAIWGALDDETPGTMLLAIDAAGGAVEPFLRQRFPALMLTFFDAMNDLFGRGPLQEARDTYAAHHTKE